MMNSCLYYKLDKSLDGNKIIQDIKGLLVGESDLSNSIIKISIQKITHEDTSHILKLEHKKL